MRGREGRRLPGFLVPECRLSSFGAAEEMVIGLGRSAGLACFDVDILLRLRLLGFHAHLFSWPTLGPASELRFQLDLNMSTLGSFSCPRISFS